MGREPVMSAAAQEQHELLGEIIEAVWASLLQAEAVPWFGPEPVESAAVRAEVTLTGDWNGAIPSHSRVSHAAVNDLFR